MYDVNVVCVLVNTAILLYYMFILYIIKFISNGFFKYVTCFDIAFAKKEDTNAWLQDFVIILGAS